MINAKIEFEDMLKNINKTKEDIVAMKFTNVRDKIKELNNIEDLDFEYNDGFGGQELDGLVLFRDKTWLERGEYDGSEWWDYKKPPTIEDIKNL